MLNGSFTVIALSFRQVKGEVRRNRQLKIGRFDQHSNESLDIEKSPVEYLVVAAVLNSGFSFTFTANEPC